METRSWKASCEHPCLLPRAKALAVRGLLLPWLVGGDNDRSVHLFRQLGCHRRRRCRAVHRSQPACARSWLLGRQRVRVKQCAGELVNRRVARD